MNTLLGMREEEIEDMMNSLSHIFRWELLVGERYGIKAAVRAERRRLEDEEARKRGLYSCETANYALDALSQEGLSEPRMCHAIPLLRNIKINLLDEKQVCLKSQFSRKCVEVGMRAPGRLQPSSRIRGRSIGAGKLWK